MLEYQSFRSPNGFQKAKISVAGVRLRPARYTKPWLSSQLPFVSNHSLILNSTKRLPIHVSKAIFCGRDGEGEAQTRQLRKQFKPQTHQRLAWSLELFSVVKDSKSKYINSCLTRLSKRCALFMVRNAHQRRKQHSTKGSTKLKLNSAAKDCSMLKI